MDPVLIEVPARIETERMILRCPMPGDGAVRNASSNGALACASIVSKSLGSISAVAGSR